MYFIIIFFIFCWSLFRDDIERAARKLKTLGSGFQLLSVGNQKMIQSVPCELSTDHTTILVVAQEKHFVTPKQIESELKWRKDRIDSVMVRLCVVEIVLEIHVSSVAHTV
jgi:hypothetical protein